MASVVVMISLCSCVSRGNLKIPRKEYRARIHRVVVVRVYTNSELFLKLSQPLAELNFDKKFESGFSYGIPPGAKMICFVPGGHASGL